MRKKKLTISILGLILLLGFTVRLYRFNNPIADWHSWRQADTSAVSRNFIMYGFDVLHPHYDDISNVQSGKDNPQGYRFVEFPIYNIAQAGLYKVFGIFTLEEWGRLVTIFASDIAAVFLYLIVSRHSNKTLGILTAFFYLFIPFDIYYGRTILPDTSMAMAILGGIYFFDKWLENGEKIKNRQRSWQSKSKKLLLYFLAMIFTASAFLLKPYAIFFTLPMFILAYYRFRWKFLLRWQLWLFMIASIIPLILWRVWMLQYPQGIPASSWLLNGNGIRFRPAFFRWIFYERLTKLISGYLGILIFIFGLIRVKKLKEWIFFGSFLLSSLIYICIFATGNVQHDYYQILIMPSIAIFFAIGSYFLYQLTWRKIAVGKVVLVISVFSLFYFGWGQVKDYFNINNPSIVVAGEAVDKLTPKNAEIIANYNGDTSFLYQTKRRGWPSFEHDLPTLIKMGARYLVLANPTPQDLQLGKKYKIIASTKQYVIFELEKP